MQGIDCLGEKTASSSEEKYSSRKGEINPDNSLGREMMAKQFCRLGEVHSLVYGRRASGENGRKLTASTRVGSESRLMDYPGLTLILSFFV